MAQDTLPVILTPDGSKTALNERFGEAYGSRHGAAAQAQHVFVGGTETDLHPQPKVLEIGFGVGVNLRATLAATARAQAPLQYIAYEFDPVSVEVLRAVSAGDEAAEHPAWLALLEAWPKAASTRQTLIVQTIVQTLAAPITTATQAATQAQPVSISIHFQDVLNANLPQNWASALYLDGFSPSRNPEVWTPEFVSRLAKALAVGGILGTYSAAGHVRRALAAAGLIVKRRVGATGKRECLQAIKSL